ncbi:beta-N-acetylglucosaminidase domain-containing protein [Brachybacterium alimentarium]|uniref:beta-N-acetylglucosaminidase domain-containing protein n=1 Tax=Brachybacterium alimentarium TaxID=47845 RepID=UPI003FCFF55B
MNEQTGFATRGILECFYGELWSVEDRAAMIRMLPEYGANLYVYGPAADRRTGARWRDPYEGAAAAQQEALLDETRRAGALAAWRVSPSAPMDRGMAMRLGDEAEQELLVRRCLEQVERGYEMIVLAFDDIDTAIDPTTRSRFSAAAHPLAAAQASVTNRVHRDLQEAGARLVVCPTHYWGTEPSAYRTEFGRLTDAELPLWWTGPGVCAEEIRAEHVRTVAEQYGHRLWVWDNYPVNDWAATELRRRLARETSGSGGHTNDRIPDQLLGAPLDRRDPQLSQVVAGFGANGAWMPGLSRLILRTSLDYARDPNTYDPKAALEDALARECVPAAAYRTVLAELGSTPVSCSIGALAAISARLLTCPPHEAELTTTEEERLDTVLRACRDLNPSLESRANDVAVTGVVEELSPWVDELAWSSHALRAAASMLRAWSDRDHRRLYAGAASISDRPRADLSVRPLVASGAVHAVVARTLALAGPSMPDWPDGL